MAVIYLFDSEKKLKKTVKKVSEIIHREGEYQAEAHITAKDSPDNGDFFGFKCFDGLFRMFLITAVDEDDETGECTLTGIDAAAAELDGIVVESLRLENISPIDALYNVLDGKGWNVRFLTSGDDFTAPAVYYQTAWTVLETISRYGNVRLQMEYAFSGGEIAQKIIWVRPRDEGFSGLIYTRKKGARNIQITKEGTPYGRVYPIGKVIGDEEPPEQVTIADAVWSVANGDPTDKPAGQTWIAIPGAKSDAGYVYEDKTETDPLALMKKGFADLESKQHWKASGTALISDMETVGWQNRGAKMWQSIAIRTESGQTIEATILNIERYYVRKELTKVTVGEETTLEDQIISMNTLLAETVKAAGGAGAGAGKAKKMVLEAEELIQLNSQQIELNAQQLITLRVATEEVRTELDETIVSFNETKLTIEDLKGELSTTKTDVNNATNEVNQLKGSVKTLAGEVEVKASQSSLDDLGNLVEEHEAYLRVLPDQIKAKADLILLEGYVKASQLEAATARFDDVFAGRTNADYLYVNHTIGAQTGQFTNVSLLNYDAAWKDLTMGEIKPGISYLGKKSQGAIDLEHSHKLVYDEATGTFTLAGVSSSGDSFNIADTQFYKDGVEAAAKEVTLEQSGWKAPNAINTVTASNGEFEEVSLPPFTVEGGDTWSSEHKTTVTFSTESLQNGLPVKQKIVDATSVFKSVTMEGLGWYGMYQTIKASNENKLIIKMPSFGYEQGGWYEDHTAYVTVFSNNADGTQSGILNVLIDASDIYALGVKEGAGDSGEAYLTGFEDAKLSYKPISITRTSYEEELKVLLVKASSEKQDVLVNWQIDVSDVFADGDAYGYNRGKADWNPVELIRSSYDLTAKTVIVRALNTAGVPVIGAAIDASELYEKGKADWNPAELVRYDYNIAQRTVSVRATNAAGVPLIAADIDASELYTAGSDSVTLSTAGWVGPYGTNEVKASNGKSSIIISLPEFSVVGGDSWTEDFKTTVSFITPSVGGAVKQSVVDASGIYDKGKRDWTPVDIERTDYDTAKKTVTVRAVNSAGVPVLGGEEISASEIYEKGKTDWSPVELKRYAYSEGQKTVSVRALNAAGVPLIAATIDASEIYAKGQRDYQPEYITRTSYDTTGKTVTVRAENAAGVPVLGNQVISAKEIYNQGQTDYQPESITRTGYDTTEKTVTVRAENAAGVPVLGNQVISAKEIYNQGQTDWKPESLESISQSESTVTVRAYNAAGVPVIAGEVDASEVFSAGEETVKGNVTIGIDAPESIINLGNNVYQMKVRIWAKYNGETIASTYAYPTKGLY